jgi:hypothetical protein
MGNAIELISNTNERCISDLEYGYFEFATEEQINIILNHTTIECLLNKIASCNEIVSYCYELYKENPSIFKKIIIIYEGKIQSKLFP